MEFAKRKMKCYYFPKIGSFNFHNWWMILALFGNLWCWLFLVDVVGVFFCGCGFFLALLPVLRSYALIAAVSACINWPRADPLSWKPWQESLNEAWKMAPADLALQVIFPAEKIRVCISKVFCVLEWFKNNKKASFYFGKTLQAFCRIRS